VFEGEQEVLVDLHRLGVAAGGAQGLGPQPGPLFDRVGELGAGGADLEAERDQVPALGQPKAARAADSTRSRASVRMS
jgi:hypothetical protein